MPLSPKDTLIMDQNRSIAPNPILMKLAPSLFVFIWATGFIVSRFVSTRIGPLTFLTYRYVGALLGLTVVAILLRAPWPKTYREWLNGAISGILLHAIYLGGVFWSVRHGMPAGVASLIVGLQPIATAALSGPLLGEPVSRPQWIGVGVGFIGAILVISPKLGISGGLPPTALAVCILGMVGITLGTVWQKRTGAAANLVTGTVVQYIAAFVVTLPLALATEEFFGFALTPSLVLSYLWSVCGLSIGAILLLLLLIRHGAVASVASLIYLVPPIAAFTEYVVYGETLTIVQMIGMAAAAAGVAIANKR